MKTEWLRALGPQKWPEKKTCLGLLDFGIFLVALKVGRYSELGRPNGPGVPLGESILVWKSLYGVGFS